MLFELLLLDDSLFQFLMRYRAYHASLALPRDNIKKRHQAQEQYHRPNNFITPDCSQDRYGHDYLETFTPSQAKICISIPSHPAQIRLFPLHPLTSFQSNHLKPTFAFQAQIQSSQWSSRTPLLLRVSNLPLPSTLTSILTQPQLPPVAAASLCKFLTYTPPNRTIPHHHDLTPFVCQSG